jgi:hypothetical protein
MNSLQLINKIKSKSDDLHKNINELLFANQSLHRIQKDLLNKQCLDLYELLLKLKIDEENIEDKFHITAVKEEAIIKTEPQEIIQHSVPIAMEEVIAPIVNEIETANNLLVQTDNFQEVINWSDNQEESIDSIAEKVANIEPIKPIEASLDEKAFVIPEVNISKATENKRIQYTVMPEAPKPNPLNTNFTEKAPSYNDKMSINNPPILVPLADKTIEAPIDNIKGAINLNKKIAFVKMLFNENVVEYAKAIERLNNATDRIDAMRIHNELKDLHAWENQHELVQELEQLIKRRFA